MTNNILNIQIDQITESPFQGRLMQTEVVDDNIETEDKALNSLTKSIATNGLMNPIIVRLLENGNYEIIDGHRRLMAHKLLKKTTIGAIVKDYSDRQAQAFSVIGNLERKNLNPIELALAYQKILDNNIYKTKKELSLALSKDETYVGDLINLLKMDNRILKDITKNHTISDIRMLRMIRNVEPANMSGISPKQYRLYQKVVKEAWNRNQLRDYLKEKKKKPEQIDLKLHNKKIEMVINTSKLNQVQRATLMDSVKTKMEEIRKIYNYLID